MGKDPIIMNAVQLQPLLLKLRSGELSRRAFIRHATAMGLSATTAGVMAERALAQDASPAASPSGSPVAGGTKSITRQEYQAQLFENFELEEPGQTGGQLIYLQTTDLRTLHPHLWTDVYSSLVGGYVYEYLATASAIDGTPVPQLADYWELAGDGITYTFYLAENAMWHDGEAVTADDVIFSFDIMVAEDSLSVRRSGVVDALASYTKVDNKTVQLVSNGPWATFLYDTAFVTGIMPKHLWENVPVGEMGSDPGSTGQDPARVIGSGPFRFVEWVLGDHATIERNADYRDPESTPVIDQFIYRVVADPASAVASLQTGEVDIIEVTPPTAEELRQNPDLTITDYDTTSFNYFYANQDEVLGLPFTDVKVRQALMYALDRDVIAETIYQGFAVRAVGTQPVLSIAYAPDKVETDYVYDPDKARALLDEAGWAVGDDDIRAKEGQRLSFEILYAEGQATYEQQIPYMQQSWREVGIELLPTAIPFPTLIDSVNAGNFQMATAGFSWDINGDQGDMYRCNAVPPSGFNRMRYCNPKYDELNDQSARELDEERRIDLLIEQSNIINNDAANGIVVFTRDIMGNGPRVHNFLPNGYFDFWALPYMWVMD
jgi:peptide/nickel transport system substrate-binding protein